jgi:Cdc6-like AAA superfamily ATPase
MPEKSARDEGDTRRAIFLLQVAGSFAKKTKCSKIQPVHIMMEFQKVKKDISLLFVLNLTFMKSLPGWHWEMLKNI